jgi:hypothetical protein
MPAGELKPWAMTIAGTQNMANNTMIDWSR